MENQKIKVGIYTSGASVRLIGEHDLTTQKYGHREDAIYLVEISMMRDPRNPFTPDDIESLIRSMKQNFVDNRFQFKAKDRAEADLFITSKLKGGWEPVRELSEV